VDDDTYIQEDNVITDDAGDDGTYDDGAGDDTYDDKYDDNTYDDQYYDGTLRSVRSWQRREEVLRRMGA
jgi:hypothetical protein